MFIDGVEIDRFYETAAGVIWVAGLVSVREQVLKIDQLLIYPSASGRLEAGVAAMLEIVRSLKDEAEDQGLTAYMVRAERMYKGKPRRMILISGRLK